MAIKPEPSVVACEAIVRIMGIGSLRDGCNEDWRNKPAHYHITKGIRHATTALMVILGVISDDGEDHLGEALTRLAMAMCKEKV